MPKNFSLRFTGEWNKWKMTMIDCLVFSRVWQTDKLEWEYLPAKADLLLVPPERHAPVLFQFLQVFATFFTAVWGAWPSKNRRKRGSPVPVFARFEERIDDNLEISRNTLVLFTFLPWRSFWALHFGQLPFPSVALFFLLHWLHWRTSQAGWFGFATCWSQVEQEVHPPISNWWKSMRVMAFLVQLVQFHSVCVSIGAVCWQNCRVFQVNVVGTAFLLAYHHALVREISATFSG